jgi:hypothetical protein
MRRVLALPGLATAIVAGLPSCNSDVRAGALSPLTLVAIALRPSQVTVSPGTTAQFEVQFDYSDGETQVVASDQVNWGATGGSVSGAGLYTAGSTTGTYRVIATDPKSGFADTASVTIPAAPVLAAVVLTPVTVRLQIGASQQFTVTGRMSDNSTTTITVNYQATGGTITAGGRYTAGNTTGSFLVIATVQGGTLADTSAVTIGNPPPPPPGGVADPTLLPVADGTAGTSVPNVAAGESYLDEFSGARVWRITDPDVPVKNTDAHHDYSNGPVQVSRGWGTNTNTHTLLVSAGNYWLVDVTRGVGLSNWRRPPISPQADICWTFANDPAYPQIAYVISGGTLHRVNTATNTVEDTPGFPKSGMGSGACWLMNSADDDWFSTHISGTSRAYQVSTGLFANASGGGEAYMDKGGRYMVQPSESGPVSQIWDPVTNTKQPVSLPASHFVHGAMLRGIAVTFDVDYGQGVTPLYTVDVATATASQTFTWPVYSPDYHMAGQWLQDDVGAAQWVLRSAEQPFQGIPGPCNRAICIFRANGTDGIRQLAYTYSSDVATYWHTAKGTWSPDGKMVMFTSDRGGSARGDVFLAEVPLR